MKWFFSDETRKRALERELLEWLGTPYRYGCAVKGKGTDCARFVAAVLAEVGAVNRRRIIWPDWGKDWHLHKREEMMRQYIERYLNAQLAAPPYWPGDLLLYRYGRAAGHIGIYHNNCFWHCREGEGVVATPLTQMRIEPSYIYRLVG